MLYSRRSFYMIIVEMNKTMNVMFWKVFLFLVNNLDVLKVSSMLNSTDKHLSLFYINGGTVVISSMLQGL